MKRVSETLLVVDDTDNRVGFVNANSLAIVNSVKYQVEGYLSGALGFKFNEKKHIYLWFSSGDLLLVDGLTHKLKSQFKID